MAYDFNMLDKSSPFELVKMGYNYDSDNQPSAFEQIDKVLDNHINLHKNSELKCEQVYNSDNQLNQKMGNQTSVKKEDRILSEQIYSDTKAVDNKIQVNLKENVNMQYMPTDYEKSYLFTNWKNMQKDIENLNRDLALQLVKSRGNNARIDKLILGVKQAIIKERYLDGIAPSLEFDFYNEKEKIENFYTELHLFMEEMHSSLFVSMEGNCLHEKFQCPIFKLPSLNYLPAAC